jgi:glucose/arabinose dehydrogenase
MLTYTSGFQQGTHMDREALCQFFTGTLLMALTAVQASAAPGDPVPRDATEQAHFELELVAEDLEFGWDIAFLPDGQMLISEYAGGLWVFPKGGGAPVLIPAIEDTTDDGGLRGIAPHPDFETNRLLYFCYATGTIEANHTRIARAPFDGERVGAAEIIFDADNESAELAHYGCRLLWRPDGKLIATFGDRRRHAEKSQRGGKHYGKAIRINDDGSVPADNPFVNTRGFRPEIWAYGIRNAQGAAFHPETGDIWFADHGPYGGDEINILAPGRNYGWPVATYGIDYSRTVITETPLLLGVEPPLWYWAPSVAPSSVAFYTGDEFPKWKGDLFVTTLAAKRLLRMELHGDRIVRIEPLLGDLDARLRDVAMSPDGTMYVLTDVNGGSRLYRIIPALPDTKTE